MSIYKTSRAINDPRNKEFIPKDSEISKEDFHFFHNYKEQETDKIYPLREAIYVINTGEQISRSFEELIADILDSAKYLSQEVLGETIEILQKNLRAMSKTDEKVTEEPKLEVKSHKK